MQSQHRDMNGHSPMTPTPLFERLVTEEVQELKASLRMIENLQRRLDELERVHGELEARLELEAQGKSQLESMLEERERDWAAKFQGLETEKDEWKYQLEREKSKTEQLTMLLNRKNQDIHRMLQRKYDKRVDSPSSNHSIRNIRHHGNRATGGTEPHFNSPMDIIRQSGSMETVQMRNVHTVLKEFFAL